MVNAIQLDQQQVRSTSARKAAGPDGVGRILKACADQLAEVFTTFNLSLQQSAVPTCQPSSQSQRQIQWTALMTIAQLLITL